MKTKISKLLMLGGCIITFYGFNLNQNVVKVRQDLCNSTILQNTQQKFYSDYQLDKTYNGSKIEGRKKVNISFDDPKPKTKGNEDFKSLPKGIITIKYEGLNEIKNEIVYLGKNESNTDIYTITKTQQDYDVVYIIKETHKVGTKNYTHTILLGKADPNNYGGLPLYFTAYHCNQSSK